MDRQSDIAADRPGLGLQDLCEPAAETCGSLHPARDIIKLSHTARHSTVGRLEWS